MTEGPYKGQVAEEPDYESLASRSTLVGITDLDEKMGANPESGWNGGFYRRTESVCRKTETKI